MHLEYFPPRTVEPGEISNLLRVSYTQYWVWNDKDMVNEPPTIASVHMDAQVQILIDDEINKAEGSLMARVQDEAVDRATK